VDGSSGDANPRSFGCYCNPIYESFHNDNISMSRVSMPVVLPISVWHSFIVRLPDVQPECSRATNPYRHLTEIGGIVQHSLCLDTFQHL
jgi:hypothetical protein